MGLRETAFIRKRLLKRSSFLPAPQECAPGGGGHGPGSLAWGRWSFRPLFPASPRLDLRKPARRAGLGHEPAADEGRNRVHSGRDRRGRPADAAVLVAASPRPDR